MPLLKNKLGAIYVPFLFNPDLIAGGLLSVDATFITVDSDIFRADNHYNLTRGPQLILNGNFSQEGSELGDSGTIGNSNGSVITQILNTSYNATGDGTSSFSTRPILSNFNVTNGKAYKLTITPSNQSGDIRFTISNDGPNLVEYNDLSSPLEFYFVNGANFRMFFDGTKTFNVDFEISLKEVGQNWVFNNSGGSYGWRILDGKAICDASAVTPNRNLNSATTLTAGKTYRLNLDILQSEDNMQVIVGGTTLSQTLPTGTHINYEYIIEGSEHNGGIFALYAGSSDLQEVDNISIAEDTTYGPELVSNGNFSQIGTEEVSNGNFSQEGSELITNGDFANWTNDNPDNYVVLNQNANNYVTESNGQLRMVSDNSATIAIRPEPTNMLSSAKIYKVSVDLTFTTGTIDISGNSFNTSGTKVFYLTAPASYLQIAKASALDVLIDNISVKEVGQNWSLGNKWSIGENSAIRVPNSTSNLSQAISGISGKTIKVSYEVSNYVGGDIGASADGVSYNANNGNGTFVEYIKPTSNNFYLRASYNFEGSITNISVKEVGQDWTLSSGTSVINSQLVIDALDGSYQYAKQLFSTTVGSTYKLEFDITEINSAGKVQLLYNNVVIGETEYTSTGSHTLYFESTNSSGTLEIKRKHPSDSKATIDNISVKEDRSLNIL